MNEQQCRAAFEKWAEGEPFILDKDHDGDYMDQQARIAFKAYQAASQAKNDSWCEMDYNNVPEEGTYWVVLESPAYNCDCDDYGNVIGTPTGKTKRRVLLARIECELQPSVNGEPEGYPVAYSVDQPHQDMADDEYITHYAAVETSPTLLPNAREPLTNDEIRSIAKNHLTHREGAIEFAREIERWHGVGQPK